MEQEMVITAVELKELLHPKNVMKLLAGLSGLFFEKIYSLVPNEAAVKEVIADTPVVVTKADLTEINGIGPTFARRLQEAGITSFAALSAQTPEYLKEVTKAADWQANPMDWIAQAKALA